jgi:hypothetical protein
VIFFSKAIRTALQPTRSPIQWESGTLFPTKNRPNCEAFHVFPSSAEDKKAKATTSLHPPLPPLWLHTLMFNSAQCKIYVFSYIFMMTLTNRIPYTFLVSNVRYLRLVSRESQFSYSHRSNYCQKEINMKILFLLLSVIPLSSFLLARCMQSYSLCLCMFNVDTRSVECSASRPVRCNPGEQEFGSY